MKNYVISLSSSVDRRKHIKSEFLRENVSFEFFDAITPINAIDIIKQDFPNLNIKGVSTGELACIASHISVWKIALNTNLDYIAVFEDDIFLSNTARDFLINSAWMDTDWSIVKLETFYERVILSSGKKILNNHSVHLLKTAHFGAAGYILSQKAIHDLFSYIRNLKSISPLDHILFSDMIKLNRNKIYQVNPAICIQEKILKNEVQLSNSLNDYRNNFSPEKFKINITRKIIRELRRLFQQLKLMLLARKISFK